MYGKEYEEFLASLKVGDEVCFNTSRYGKTYRIGKIKRITPTRRFVVESNGVEYKFGSDGRNKETEWHTLWLEKYDEIIVNIYKRGQLESDIKGRIAMLDMGKMSIENLEKLLAVLKEVQS